MRCWHKFFATKLKRSTEVWEDFFFHVCHSTGLSVLFGFCAVPSRYPVSSFDSIVKVISNLHRGKLFPSSLVRSRVSFESAMIQKLASHTEHTNAQNTDSSITHSFVSFSYLIRHFSTLALLGTYPVGDLSCWINKQCISGENYLLTNAWPIVH